MGVPLTGQIERVGVSDTYATHNNNFGLEGFFVVNNFEERDLIPTAVRGTKCTAFVIDIGDGTANVYYIDDSVDVADNANWKLWQSGAVSGGIFYIGNWDANTNTPTVVDATGTNGQFYVVDVAGSQDLGSGSQTFAIGDWVIYDGGIWRKLAQAGNTNDWDTMINKPSTFPPDAHSHVISDVTDLQLNLDGKIDTTAIDTVEPTDDAARITASALIKAHFDDITIHFVIDDASNVADRAFSSQRILTKFATDTLTPDEINTLIAGVATYGIRFYADSVTDPKENYSAAASEFDYLLETDTRDVWQWIASAWLFRYNLDAVSFDDDPLMGEGTPSTTTGPTQNAVQEYVRNIDEINKYGADYPKHIKGENVLASDDQYIIELDAVNGSGYIRFDNNTGLFEFSADKVIWTSPGVVVEESQFQFLNNMDTVRVAFMRGSLNVTGLSGTTGLATTYIESSLDNGTTYTVHADVAALNTWIGANTTGDSVTGTEWVLKLTVEFNASEEKGQAVNLTFVR